jgi:hypothetical protein
MKHQKIFYDCNPLIKWLNKINFLGIFINTVMKAFDNDLKSITSQDQKESNNFILDFKNIFDILELLFLLFNLVVTFITYIYLRRIVRKFLLKYLLNKFRF